MAVFHLKGQARRWYQLLFNDEGLVNWKRFKAAIFARFGPSLYENHLGELTKLTQSGTMQEYINAFETALEKTRQLPQDQLVS